MKNDVLFNTVDTDQAAILRSLKTIEQKLERAQGGKDEVIAWQLEELRRLQAETSVKSQAIADLQSKLQECSSQAEGNRQLINKLITDIGKLQQNVDWYKRTYETRSLLGLVKDKLKYFFK